jgi:predicted Zn finger-like uncharacterized protein
MVPSTPGAAMQLEVRCPSCETLLRVPDSARGRLVRCPKCSDAVRVQAADAASAERITDRPAALPVARRRPPVEDDSPLERPRRRAQSDEEARPARRKPRREEPADEIVTEAIEDDEIVTEAIDEVEEIDEPPPKPRRKKKKRKKKLAYLPPEEDGERETPDWVWWTFGGGGVALTLLTLLLLVLLAEPASSLKFYAAYLLVMMPISTVIFFGAMILSNLIAEAGDIGEIHVALFKAFGLLLVINILSLVRFQAWGGMGGVGSMGGWITLPVWVGGLMVLFHLDFWEARVLIFFNWLLNFLVRLLLFATLSAWIMHGGGVGDRDRGSSGTPNAVWDGSDVEDHGGSVEYDPLNDQVVVGISFRNLPIGDAELVHMKDFPRLTTLDLSGTRVSDAGLKHLAPCKHLRTLVLTGTRVTDAGVQELQRNLPLLRIVR